MENLYVALVIFQEICKRILEFIFNHPESTVYVVIILGLLVAFLMANQKNNGSPE